MIFELCIIPLLAILSKFVIDLIVTKKQELQSKIDSSAGIEAIELISRTVIKCVQATNQTYVESLKQSGAFDKEAQKIALEKTYQAVINILGEDIIHTVTNNTSEYLTTLIEAEIYRDKNGDNF